MEHALHHRLARLRARIDALKEGRVEDAGFWDQAIARLGAATAVPAFPALDALDRDLDRVGVHTAADAMLLRDLGVHRGMAAELASGLVQRAAAAIEELEEGVVAAERALLIQKMAAGTALALDAAWPKAARALKAADIFAAPPAQEVPFELLASQGSALEAVRPQSARVAIAQFWAARARQNLMDVIARRRDLDAAHELLLRVGSEVDRDQVRALRMQVSDARERARQVPPARGPADLFRHVRQLAMKDPSSAFRAVRGLYERAVEAGEEEIARAAWEAARAFSPDASALKARLEAQESETSSVLRMRVENGGAAFAKVRSPTSEEAYEERLLLDAALGLGDRALEAFDLATGCLRYFDVESALGEEILSTEPKRPRPRRVPYPTERLEFELTAGFHEVRDFVIADPRMVLYDVASGKQLVRAWLEEVPPPAPNKIRKTAVRVYVCDASGSMHGARARFRDAILLSELNNIRTRARAGEPFDPLYFCFFNDAPTQLVRVEEAAGATRQIRHLLTSAPAEGQTDITLALIQAFDSIRAAHGTDPYLARATVVLVTDGEDRVDLDRIRQARAPVDGVEISLSFIALGEENRDLKSLAMEQRALGGRAFYVHLSDREILLARTEFDSRRRTLLPADVPVSPATLDRLGPHLEALFKLAKGEEVAQFVPSANFDGLFPAAVVEAARAAAEEGAPAPLATKDGTLLRIVDILEAVAEACGLAPPDVRAQEAVVLLHHLLELYELSVPAYVELVAVAQPAIARAIAHIRLLVGPLT